MVIKHSLAIALRMLRKARGLSQDAFSNVSSRTYLSSLERDLKCPTLNKLGELCEVLDVHPLTLLMLAYSDGSVDKTDKLLMQVQCELASVLKIDHKVVPAGLPHWDVAHRGGDLGILASGAALDGNDTHSK